MCSCNVCSRSSRPDATINAARHVVSRDAIARHARHVEPHRRMEMDEDNEITLAEGDQIVDIEFASEDWWSGTNARTGAMGLFPANYVERLS